MFVRECQNDLRINTKSQQEVSERDFNRLKRVFLIPYLMRS